MGLDFHTSRRKEAEAAGAPTHWRVGYGTMLLVLDTLGPSVIDFENEGPRWRHSDEEASEAAFVRWEAERRVRMEAASDGGRPVTVAAVLFGASNGHHIYPAECRALAAAARNATVEDARRAIEADEREMELLREEHDPPDVDAASRSLLKIVQDIGAYCEQAAAFGGFKAD